MGVNGLWKLLDPSGKPVPLETLENKVLAVDVSIWLHQVVKGFHDSHGNPLPNAHLLGLFHRICKLLFYKIKPVFVFDGGVPHLKKQTVALRNQHKNKAEIQADRVREQLLKNLAKHTALKRVLGSNASNVDLSITRQSREDDMFELPPEKKNLELSGSEDDTLSSEDEVHHHKNWGSIDLHSVDVNSSHFKSLPADVRHDILSELKETRKQSSWGRLHEMPKESNDFSSYQMTRLLKRRSIQVSLEDAEKEMGGRSLSLGELEQLLSEQGVVKNIDATQRIASDSSTRFLYVKDIGKQIMAKSTTTSDPNTTSDTSQTEQDNKIAENENNNDSDVKILESVHYDEVEEVTGDWTSNSEEDCIDEEKLQQKESANLKLAQNFIFENSGLTQEQILAVIQYQKTVENKIEQNSEPSLSVDLPSTSGLSSVKTDKEKVLQDPACTTSCKVESATKQESSNIADNRSHVSNESCGYESKTGSDPGEVKGDNAECIVEISKTVSHTQIESKVRDASHDCSPTSKGNDKECYVVENKNLDSKKDGGDVVHDSNSDSDTGFVEVADASIEQVRNTKSPKNSLEILIKYDQSHEIKDDIFADIFSTNKLSVAEQEVDKEEVFKSSETLKNNKEKEYVTETNSNSDKHIPHEVEPQLIECLENKVSNESLNNIYQSESERKDLTLQNGSIKDVEKLNVEKSDIVEEEIQEKIIPVSVSTEELQKMQVSLEEQHKDLLVERGRQERLATNITDQMYMEAQELLQLFGVPYLVAPMEAEAQCAFLDLISLTDGTITDDSDIWLFGGQKVYKNFFNQKKHVLHYKAEDIKHYFKLDRQQLILLALLVGSDYTPGIQGVGPVTALEILAAFPTSGEDNNEILQGLQKFREWWHGGMSVGPGRTPLKNKLRDLQFIEGFPNVAVVDAYLNPKVDDSRETFSWASPDLQSLTDFTRRKFGWTKTKADEILLPVMKKLEERKSQRSLDSYFKVIPKLQAAEGKLSKRVKQAVHRLGKEGSSDSDETPLQESTSNQASQPKRKCIDTTGTSRGRKSRRGSGRGTFLAVGTSESTQNISTSIPTVSGEFIPQRERDKINALKSKMKAIEVFRTSKTGLDRTKRQKRIKRQILKEAKLSESSSDSQ